LLWVPPASRANVE
jgi:Niemann-Pick C1 protein